MIGALDTDIFAFIKPSIDAHTLGVNSAVELLRDCGYKVLIGDEIIAKAMNDFKYEVNREIVLDWIKREKISRIGLSYRLDQDDAVNMVGRFMNELRNRKLLDYQGGPIKSVFFGGLPKTCEIIEKEHQGFVRTFMGGESVRESLTKMCVPEDHIPRHVMEGSLYDDLRMEFAKEVIDSQAYENFVPVDKSGNSHNSGVRLHQLFELNMQKYLSFVSLFMKKLIFMQQAVLWPI